MASSFFFSKFVFSCQLRYFFVSTTTIVQIRVFQIVQNKIWKIVLRSTEKVKTNVLNLDLGEKWLNIKK